jgi:hypothetical protein
MLPKVTSPQFEEIQLHFSSFEQWDEDEALALPKHPTWVCLDQILTSQTLASLRVVRIISYIQMRNDHIYHWLKKQLPLSYARGFLQWRHGKDGM